MVVSSFDSIFLCLHKPLRLHWHHTQNILKMKSWTPGREAGDHSSDGCSVISRETDETLHVHVFSFCPGWKEKRAMRLRLFSTMTQTETESSHAGASCCVNRARWHIGSRILYQWQIIIRGSSLQPCCTAVGMTGRWWGSGARLQLDVCFLVICCHITLTVLDMQNSWNHTSHTPELHFQSRHWLFDTLCNGRLLFPVCECR